MPVWHILPVTGGDGRMGGEAGCFSCDMLLNDASLTCCLPLFLYSLFLLIITSEIIERKYNCSSYVIPFIITDAKRVGKVNKETLIGIVGEQQHSFVPGGVGRCQYRTFFSRKLTCQQSKLNKINCFKTIPGKNQMRKTP